MSIISAIVLFAVIWFMLLFIALPLRQTTQQEDGTRVPGTPASAPINPMIGKKMFWVTVVTVILWVPLVWFIQSGILTIDDINFWGRG